MNPLALKKTVMALAAIALLVACGDKSSEAPSAGTEQPFPPEEVAAESLPEFDPALDPVTVAPEYLQMLGDTLGMQMYVLTMKPRDSVGLHQHLDHTVYVMEGGTLLVYVNGTDPVEYPLNMGDALISGPLTDAAINTGETTIKLLITEVHRPRTE